MLIQKSIKLLFIMQRNHRNNYMIRLHNFIVNYFTYFISLLIGLFYCLFMIYIRFIIEHFPKELTFWIYTDINVTLHYTIIILMCVHLTIYLSILYITVKEMFNKQIKIRWIHKIYAKFYYIIKTSVINFIGLFTGCQNEKIQNIILVGAYFYIHKIIRFGSHPKSYIVYYWIQKLIYLLLGLCFIIDVIFYFKLFYFYKALSLLGIIILMDFTNFFFAHFLEKEASKILKDFDLYFFFYEANNTTTFVRQNVIKDANGYYRETTLAVESYKNRNINGWKLETRPTMIYNVGFETIEDLERNVTESYTLHIYITLFRGYYAKYAEQMDRYVWTILSLIYISGWLYVIGVNIL